MRQSCLKFYSWIKNNPLILMIFLASTAFFLIQHWFIWSWDYSVYILNAKYWLSNGVYFEMLRPPIASFVMGVLHFVFGWKGVEYFYLILVSVLFAVSSVKLADFFKINKELFYLLELSPFVLLAGQYAGTELLSLALLQLGIIVLSGNKSGLLFGLASLVRYDNLIYVFMLFFKKDSFAKLKDLIVRIFFFLIPIVIWLVFNYFAFGSFWASIGDSYAVNVKLRPYVLNFNAVFDFLKVIGWYAPFFVIGLWKSRKFEKKLLLILIAFAVLSIISYLKTPWKETRYLFNFAMPVAFFTTLAFEKILKNKKHILVFILLLNLGIAACQLLPMDNRERIEYYTGFIPKLDCACASNVWVVYDWLGVPCEPAPRKQFLDEYINEGYKVLFFTNQESDYVKNETFLSDKPILEQGSDYYLIGNSSVCKTITNVRYSYLEGYSKIEPLSYCESLFGSLCKLV